MQKTTVSQHVDFYRPDIREIVKMMPILNSLQEHKGDLVLTEESCKLLYTTLTKMGFVSTETQKQDIYKITIKESSRDVAHQRINAISLIMNILNLNLTSVKDIIDKNYSTTCTAAQIKVLREKLTPFGYDVVVFYKM